MGGVVLVADVGLSMGFLSVIPDGARSNGSGLSCLTRSLNAVGVPRTGRKAHLNGYFKFKEADSMTMSLAQSLGWQGLPLMIICAAIDAPSAWAFPPIGWRRVSSSYYVVLHCISIACHALSRAWFGSLFANDHDGSWQIFGDGRSPSTHHSPFRREMVVSRCCRVDVKSSVPRNSGS